MMDYLRDGERHHHLPNVRRSSRYADSEREFSIHFAKPGSRSFVAFVSPMSAIAAVRPVP